MAIQIGAKPDSGFDKRIVTRNETGSSFRTLFCLAILGVAIYLASSSMPLCRNV